MHVNKQLVNSDNWTLNLTRKWTYFCN